MTPDLVPMPAGSGGGDYGGAGCSSLSPKIAGEKSTAEKAVRFLETLKVVLDQIKLELTFL